MPRLKIRVPFRMYVAGVWSSGIKKDKTEALSFFWSRSAVWLGDLFYLHII